MKTTKRIISLAMAVAVLASLFVAVPVSAATTTGDILNWTFDDEVVNTEGVEIGKRSGHAWKELDLWDETDIFYGPENRYTARVYDSLGNTPNLQVAGNGSSSQIHFKNAGYGQTKANAVDNAQYFGANSVFGKPYYVEMTFYANIVKSGTTSGGATNNTSQNWFVGQLFGQHFEGTLADGTMFVSSGPAIEINPNGILYVSDGFKDDNTFNRVSTGLTIRNNAWNNKLKVYVDPVNRTYQVWLNDTAAPETYEFGRVYHNNTISGGEVTALDAGDWQNVGTKDGTQNFVLKDGKNPNQYIKDADIVLAPNRTRIQTNGAQLRINALKIYYQSEAEVMLNEMIATFNADNNNGVIAEGATIKLPTTVPAGYESSKYEVSWSTESERIDAETGAVTTGTVSDATLTLKVVDADNNSEATKAVKVVLPVDYSEWVVNRVPYEIGGIKFKNAGVTEDAYIYSPVAGGKLSSVQFKNNTQNQVNLIAAVYDENGRLAACKIAGNPNNGKVTLNLDIPSTATNPVVKFFVWSNDGKLTPLTTSAQVFEKAGRKLFILSDSLYDETPITNQNSTGIGAALKDKFNTTNLPVVNLAQCGDSLKSFATEIVTDANTGVNNQTRLQHALSQIQPGDYVLLSFAHNDQKTEKQGEPADGELYEVGSYSYFYKKYVETIRLAGGVPIIASPTPRCQFSGDTPTSDFGNYTTHAYNVAGEYGIPFLDVHTEAKADMTELGAEASKEYYVGTASGLVANDYTHVNAAGAEWIANIIVELVDELKLPFAKYAN